MPALGQFPHHHLGIDEVLGAAETYKTNFQVDVPGGKKLATSG
jgi:hypothetical protein